MTCEYKLGETEVSQDIEVAKKTLYRNVEINHFGEMDKSPFCYPFDCNVLYIIIVSKTKINSFEHESENLVGQ